MAKQGLDWKDNKILTNTKHDQGRTETIHNIIKYKKHTLLGFQYAPTQIHKYARDGCLDSHHWALGSA